MGQFEIEGPWIRRPCGTYAEAPRAVKGQGEQLELLNQNQTDPLPES